MGAVAASCAALLAGGAAAQDLCSVGLCVEAHHEPFDAVQMLQLNVGRAEPVKAGRSADPQPVNETDILGTYTPMRRTRQRPSTILDLQGVEENEAGDTAEFLDGLVSNFGMIAACVVMFMVLRMRYPSVYSYNAMLKDTPREPSNSFLSWITASLHLSTEEVAECAGLDSAMFLEFCTLCMKVLGIIGVPMVLVMCPLHYFVGGNKAVERLGKITMSNVIDGHPWLYYVHAVVVWAVCLVTQRWIYNAQSKFLTLRFKWLEELPFPRAVTVLVEGIPPEFRSDATLKSFFQKAFGAQQVKSAYVAKQCQELESMVAKRDAAKLAKRRAELLLEKSGRRPTVKPHMFAQPVDAIAHHTEELDVLEKKIADERARVKAQAENVGGVNSDSGFVTFTARREAEIAKNLAFTPDCREWVVSVPPEPSNIIWRDLQDPPALEFITAVIGYACLGGLYIGFTPICLGITNAAFLINMGPLQSYWASLAPTMGLTLFLSFLPTVMLLVFRCFLSLKADAWAQQKLQVWYFWFQVFFVILVTAVGNDITLFMKHVAESPLSVVTMLADQLPLSTHFYANYVVLQLSAHSMSLLRYVQLGKYLTFKNLWTEAEAREMAEPEDQDYYGMGSRFARMAIVMLISIIYGTLSPIITLLGCVHFALCRLIYGYLIVYSESRKPDLGGAFWSSALKHVWFGLLIYCALMTGVLLRRAPNVVPAVAAGCSMAYTAWSFMTYLDAFQWEKLAFSELVFKEESLKVVETGEVYVQKEMLDDA